MAKVNMGINNFIGNFNDGGFRPNRYRVIMTFPSEVGGAQAANKISFACKATSVPASILGTAIAPYMGREVKFAGDRTFDDWTVTVMVDNKLVTRDAFEQWSANINATTENVAIDGWGNPSNYMANAIVQLLSNEGDVLKEYAIEGMFPINVGELTLAWDANNTIAEMPVTFAINWFQKSDTIS
jgi:hypothetical protein